MLLTIFLAVVICAAVALMMFAGVAFIQDTKMFCFGCLDMYTVLIID
ncbi:hypothetical protein SAMN02745247_01690 [Butyrivibrio hungatei DSM 14810]|uniref:Uncharacterized protein n=1 Tax=Butyrivibrio hungatei DSM 14810 TaxID=1121132 RepID=A0A1M7SFP1_9FIRM|nr:hypothetical protein [Butyrivibrio hungatei]SHN57336.1 hypothetical protein SAMN02745247_01690 [Butyrivibrio hungatei DSM 14810]